MSPFLTELRHRMASPGVWQPSSAVLDLSTRAMATCTSTTREPPTTLSHTRSRADVQRTPAKARLNHLENGSSWITPILSKWLGGCERRLRARQPPQNLIGIVAYP